MESRINYSNEYQGCFVCGKENKKGFKLDFNYSEQTDEVYTIFKPQRYMQGYEAILHGGFISMLFDEVMAKACLRKGITAVTAKIEVRFKKPIFINETLEFKGKIVKMKGRKIELRAVCLTGDGLKDGLKDGIEKAEANALFIKID